MDVRHKGAPGGAQRGARARGMFPVLLASSFAASYGQSMMNIALAHAAERFGVTLSVANWLVVGYTVVAAVSIMLAAYLLKRLGLRRLFFVACGALALGSLAAVFATTFPMLLGCRLVQAVCSGLMYPTVTGVIMQTSPPGRLGTRLAVNSGIIAVGLAVSPVATGLVLGAAGLQAVFAVPLALSIGLMAAGARFVRNIGAEGPAGADALSVALGFVGLGALVAGLGELARDPYPSLAGLAVGAVALALFARRQFKVPDPLLNLQPLRHIRFAAGLVLVMVAKMASYSLGLLLPLYFEGAAGLSAFAAGLMLLAPVLVNALFSYFGGVLYDKRGFSPVVPVGFALVLAGQAALLAAAGALLLVPVVLAAAVAYAGVGLIVPPSKTAALSQLPRSLYAHGSAINSTCVQIASAAGPSLFVGVLSADVVHGTAAGMSRAAAYTAGFEHALPIAIVLAVAGLALCLVYTRLLRAAPGRRR